MTEDSDRDCSVKDGNFVVPCQMLASLIDGTAAFSKAKGVRLWEYYGKSKTEGFRKTRSFVGVKTANWPDGFLFNFCPCCGSDISSPFYEKDDDEEKSGERQPVSA